MALTLAESYAACARVVLDANSSFALGMKLFPADRRQHVYAVYAFFRRTDDLVDDEGPVDAKRAALELWRTQVAAALASASVDGAPDFLAAVADTAARYRLPSDVFDRCIDACAADLDAVRLADRPALEAYCEGVAGTVGQACLRILGYDDEETQRLSALNARAVQYTNILRDVDEDTERDRLYLPADLLARHGVTPAHLTADPRPPELVAALAELGTETAELYRAAEPLFDRLAPRHRPPIVGLTLRYRLLFEHLADDGYRSRGKLRLSKRKQGKALMLALASRWWPTWRR